VLTLLFVTGTSSPFLDLTSEMKIILKSSDENEKVFFRLSIFHKGGKTVSCARNQEHLIWVKLVLSLQWNGNWKLIKMC
jgi:hypothetical protein